LQEKYDLTLKDIAEVEIDFPKVEYVSRPSPKTGLDGKFSVQYTTAAALLDRTITVDTFSDQRRFAPDIETLLPRVRINIRDDIPKEFQSTWAAVRVRTTEGRTLKVRCDRPRGMPGVPLTREERLAKFRYCVEPALPPADVDRLIELIERLDELPGVEPIMTIAGRAQGLRGE
jgi:aconitate decarboxylase